MQDVRREDECQQLFLAGRLVVTPSAYATLDEAGQSLQEFLSRHFRGDWGDVSEQQIQANEQALQDGAQFFSAYWTANGDRIWVVTVWDEDLTTMMIPTEDYVYQKGGKHE